MLCIFVWNNMRMKHFPSLLFPKHSLNTLLTLYQGDAPLSEAANRPQIPGPHCSLEPLICNWACGHTHCRPWFPPSSCERRAAPLCLCPRTSGGGGPKPREQTGLHHIRTAGGRTSLGSILLPSYMAAKVSPVTE